MTQRRSDRDFDVNYEIPEADFNDIIQAMRMSPSSYGILGQRLLVINRGEMRKKLAPFFYNQLAMLMPKNLSLYWVLIIKVCKKLQNIH
ncbi:Oxygen-insensitive NAD(P)H nitroreductase Dihydropteridine reductase [Mesoplasma florum W37]|uniref:Oxygen-insensitive NAD(P)H nitroreductase, Dihydropteridine reductase n=2 Tax=Mesoplasma florum TaxID=2151 RepID=A0AAD2PSL0_MESFO|nr:nitroreductase family protein [Mesoplasma florum]AGY41367.1 Oxygen-insensitive NAD(P)H nitroreductase Dihydropteridine reductase [Mesoplasma florum W37]AVN65707.1 Oxygen-insensitive NAD(P)H nitroreductase, Dihydropteridine reductase [Mesoplasma florum]